MSTPDNIWTYGEHLGCNTYLLASLSDIKPNITECDSNRFIDWTKGLQWSFIKAFFFLRRNNNKMLILTMANNPIIKKVIIIRIKY